MKSVTAKTSTLRRATAAARVRTTPATIARMRSNDLPKKDVLIVARVAATSAVKKTSELIPYCHPIPIDSVEVSFEVAEDHVDISASVEAIWKTGVEMEALTAVSMAALTVYDMLKPVDQNIVIEQVELEKKRGGKTTFVDPLPDGFRAAVVVTSDGTHEGTREDRSGKIICQRLEEFGIDPRYDILPDEEEQIVALLQELVDADTHLIITTGGTGIGPRDVTVEATRRLIEREIPGVVEASRAYGQSRTPYAMLSRSLAGVCGKSIIVNLPGSSKGAEESMNAIFPGLFHAYTMIGGGGH
jgi:molybdenum cofactor biosynthesis protein MoaC